MMPAHSSLLACNAFSRRSRPGSRRRWISSTAAMCMAVGKLSLLLWPMLTWSLGCTGLMVPSSAPSSWLARFEITSLTFMFDWVPEPVWKVTSGKWESWTPVATSSAAFIIASPISLDNLPASMLYLAQHFFSFPKARITGSGILSGASPIGKFCRLRCVCAPHRRSAGTSMGPKLSFSLRVAIASLRRRWGDDGRAVDPISEPDSAAAPSAGMSPND
mmetsp:Transcript_29135/g.76318  ORF Transcript_29135/g.76318 Transcript_29135/m.76318 type:complete len:218 (+) Transcript_29135:961-1614(+)